MITVTVNTVMLTDDRTQVLAGQLLELLRERLAEPNLQFEGEPTKLTGGFWAELFTFRLTPAPNEWDRPLVARVMPDAGIASKESAFQLEVAAQGYPTPAVRLMQGSETGIDGRAVMVMDLAEGAPLLAGLDGVAAVTKLPTLARRLPVVLADVLAQLHGLAPGPVVDRLGASDAPRPDLEQMLHSLRSTADLLDRPALAAAVKWLADHRPATTSDVICHGDMHPFNVLSGETGLTVLDWSAGVIAPREYDLGFTSLMLAEPPLMAPPLLRPVIRRAGRALSKRFLKAYASKAGVTVDPNTLAWHQGLICVRALTEVAGWAVAGTLQAREGHPWVINEAAIGGRLQHLTGITAPRESAVA
jgi:aminoglycoside phosphotransferase (APT) family kinase protein